MLKYMIKKQKNLENKKIILGVASVWDKRKGLDDFIELSTMLDDNYKIVLVGLDCVVLCCIVLHFVGQLSLLQDV